MVIIKQEIKGCQMLREQKRIQVSNYLCIKGNIQPLPEYSNLSGYHPFPACINPIKSNMKSSSIVCVLYRIMC